ncbi:MAG: PIN domain-containing protein, partial [Burkholderiaceae bacterium]
MFLLDTNTVIDYFKGKGRVADNLLAQQPNEVALPAIVVYEMWVGVLGSQNVARRQLQLEQVLSAVPVVALDAAVAKRAAQLRQTL